MKTLANNLLAQLGQMPLRRRIALCTRVILAVVLLIAGLIKINYFA